jgi:hypothetical protein
MDIPVFWLSAEGRDSFFIDCPAFAQIAEA